MLRKILGGLLAATSLIASVSAQESSGWTWVRNFEVVAGLQREPASGVAALYWGQEDRDGVVQMENELVSPLVEGQAAFDLPPLAEPYRAMLFVVADEGSTRFAPYVEHFDLGPITPPDADLGVIADLDHPVVDLPALDEDIYKGNGVASYGGVDLVTSAMAGTTVAAGYVHPSTADAFALPPQRAQDLELSIDIRAMGGVYFDFENPVGALTLAFPEVIGAYLGGRTPGWYQLVDYTTGQRLAAGEYGGIQDHWFEGWFTTDLLILFYEEAKKTPGADGALTPMAGGFQSDDEFECPDKADSSDEGKCDFVEQRCDIRMIRLNAAMPVDTCYIDSDTGEYGPSNPAGSNSDASVSSSSTSSLSNTVTQSQQVTFGVRMGGGSQLFNFSTSGNSSTTTTTSTTKTVQIGSGVSQGVTIVSGETLALRWIEYTCHYECITGFIDASPYGVSPKVEILCDTYASEPQMSVEQCETFSTTSLLKSVSCTN